MIGSGTLTKQIAGYLARTGFDALDAEALRATGNISFTSGTILAGSSAPGITQALAGAGVSGPSQEYGPVCQRNSRGFRRAGCATMATAAS
jgi:hypothetical protein